METLMNPQELPRKLKDARKRRQIAESQLTKTIQLANVEEELLNALTQQVQEKELNITQTIHGINNGLFAIESLKKQMLTIHAKTEADRILLSTLKSEIAAIEYNLNEIINIDILDTSNKLFG